MAVRLFEAEGPGVYRSGDGGWTWTLLGRVPLEELGLGVEEAVVGPAGRLYVATLRAGPDRGWVYRTGEAVTVSAEPGVPELPEQSRLRAYPNPASGVLTIEGEADEAMVLDVRGREVTRVALAGGRAEMDSRSLAPGVYFVRAGAETVRLTVR